MQEKFKKQKNDTVEHDHRMGPFECRYYRNYPFSQMECLCRRDMLTTAMVLSSEDCATFPRQDRRRGDDASSARGCPAPPLTPPSPPSLRPPLTPPSRPPSDLRPRGGMWVEAGLARHTGPRPRQWSSTHTNPPSISPKTPNDPSPHQHPHLSSSYFPQAQ